jgi:hypothetical protein
MQAMNDRYQQALFALSNAHYQAAAAQFETIVRDAGNRYLDAAPRLAEAKMKQQDTALEK